MRTGVLGLVAVLLVVFVIENWQPVDVRFWGVHSHPRLIWVIVGCLVIGGVVGYLMARPSRKRQGRGDKAGKAGKAGKA